MGEYVVELKNITKRFPGVIALKNMSIGIRPGEIHGLIGENGAGKSTYIAPRRGRSLSTARGGRSEIPFSPGRPASPASTRS